MIKACGIQSPRIPRWVFPRKRNRFRLHVPDSGTARIGQFESADPQYEQRLEGHKLGFVRIFGTTGANDV